MADTKGKANICQKCGMRLMPSSPRCPGCGSRVTGAAPPRADWTRDQITRATTKSAQPAPVNREPVQYGPRSSTPATPAPGAAQVYQYATSAGQDSTADTAATDAWAGETPLGWTPSAPYAAPDAPIAAPSVHGRDMPARAAGKKKSGSSCVTVVAGIVLFLLMVIMGLRTIVSGIYYKSGIERAKQGDTRGAIEDFTTAITLDSKDGNYYDSRGMAWMRDGNSRDALSDFDKAIANSRGEPRSVIDERRSHRAAAEKMYEIMVVRPARVKALTASAEKSEKDGKYDEAVRDYAAAVAINPKNAELRIKKSLALMSSGDLKAAKDDCESAIKLAPGNSWGYNVCGLVAYKQSDRDGALVFLKRALAISPKYVNAAGNMGDVYEEKKDYKLAEDAYTKAITIDPDYEAAWNGRGWVYYEEDEYAAAVKDFTKAIDLYHGYALAYKNRAMVYLKLGDAANVIEDSTNAIKSDPQYDWAYNLRGIGYLMKEDYPDALADFNKAIEISPKYVEAYFNRGLVYVQMNKKTEALGDFKKCLEVDPTYNNAKIEIRKLGR